MLITLFKTKDALSRSEREISSPSSGSRSARRRAANLANRADVLCRELGVEGKGALTVEQFVEACQHNEEIRDLISHSLVGSIQIPSGVEQGGEKNGLLNFENQVAGHKAKASFL